MRFWYHKPEDSFPPRDIAVPSDIEGGDRLCIHIGDDPSGALRRKRIKAWCEALPALQGIKLLWIISHVSQQLFEAACQVPGLEGLYIKYSGIQRLDALAEAASLRCFRLGNSTKVESIEPLAAKTQLECLEIENIKKISDLSPLSSLKRLDSLVVEGSMWTPQRVDTLAPLGELRQLRHLELCNLRAQDKTLRPLYSLHELRTLRVPRWSQAEEVAELQRLNPNLEWINGQRCEPR